jgi:predicted nucleic acid-binding protein
MPFVLDCSVALTWVFPDEATAALDALCDSLAQDYALVPAIWPLEITNALLAALRRGRITPDELQDIVAKLRVLSIRLDHETGEHAFTRTLVLAQKHQLTSYDAAYLELALRTGLPLATLDRQLQAACQVEGLTVLQ